MQLFKRILVYVLLAINLYMLFMICLLDTFLIYHKFDHIADVNLIIIIIIGLVFLEKIIENRSCLGKVIIFSIANIGLNYFLVIAFLIIVQCAKYCISKITTICQPQCPKTNN